MLIPLPPLEAYRSDLGRVRGRQTFGEADAGWLALASSLHRLSQLPVESRATYAYAAATAIRVACPLSSPNREAELVVGTAQTLENLGAGHTLSDYSVFQRVFESMEDDGAFLLAFSCIADLRLAFRDMPLAPRGYGIAQQGRIARQLGHLDAAVEFYDEVRQLGVDEANQELLALAAHGLGGVALARGNYPDAKQQFEHAVDRAELAKAHDLAGRGYRGLMNVEAVRGNFEEALRNGWLAYVMLGSATDASRAELLGNLAGLCGDMGYHKASLHGYLVAASLTPALRVHLPSLGAAALAASRLDRAELADMIRLRIDKITSRGAPPFETAQALISITRALRQLSDSRAETYRMRALQLSNQFGYFEIRHEAETLAAPPAPSIRKEPRPISDESARVVKELEQLDLSTSELLESAAD
ncbi:MAG: tetratricopeptide repeat protein [Gemmatimonadota bacterium]|nr:tetratricopeptide repeat protein [Gemmatimonadota bacterium]